MDRAPLVSPEARCCGGFIIVKFLEPGAQEVICELSRLRDAVASAEDFEIYPSILGGFAEVIFFDEFLRYF